MIVILFHEVEIDLLRQILVGTISFLTILFLSIVFKRLAEIYINSKEYIHSWDNYYYSNNLKVEKCIKSLKPLKIHIGNIFIISKPLTSLIVVSKILQFTGKLLLVHKGH